MELKAGYKLTEVGVIPEDWDLMSISDLSPFVTSGSRGWSAYYSDQGSPFIRITNLYRNCIYPNLDDLRFVSVSANDSEAARTQLQDDDVLISITADIGIIGHVTAAVPKPAYINQHIALVRFNAERINSKFISYFLASEAPQKRFDALTDAGAKAGMNLTTVQQIRLAVPRTKTEQRAIAGALSDADALIESLNQLTTKKRHLKQAAMQQLLTGQTRLPGFCGEWETVEFGEIATIRNAKVISSSTPTGTQCVELESIGQASGQLIGAFDASGSSSKYSFKKGDVLFGRLRAYLRKYWLAQFDGICSTEIWPLIPCDARIHKGFLHLLVQTNAFADAAAVSYGTHMPRSDWSVLRKFEVRLPSIPEQTAIATILSDMDAGLAELEFRLAKARHIKQGMMQELLTGRIRLLYF